MASPCVIIFVDGNEFKTCARDLNTLFSLTPIFLTLPHQHRKSQFFYFNTGLNPLRNSHSKKI